MGERDACRILGENPEKKSLGRPKRSRVDDIKMDIIEIDWDSMDFWVPYE
jgi:hypothetical protein